MKDDHNKKSQYKVPRQTVLMKRYMLIGLSINLIIIFSDDGSTENVTLFDESTTIWIIDIVILALSTQESFRESVGVTNLTLN